MKQKKPKESYTLSKRFIEKPRDLVAQISQNENARIEAGMYLNQKNLEESPEVCQSVRFAKNRECKCCNRPIDKGGHYCPPCAMGRCKH